MEFSCALLQAVCFCPRSTKQPSSLRLALGNGLVGVQTYYFNCFETGVCLTADSLLKRNIFQLKKQRTHCREVNHGFGEAIKLAVVAHLS